MAENIERNLDWDDTIEKDSDFELLPAGDYAFTVESVERGRYEPKEGAKLPPCNQATVNLRIEYNGNTVTVQHRLFLHSRCEGMLKGFFVGIGQGKKNEPLKMNWAAVPGSKGRCKIGIREWTSRSSGETMQGNEVKRFYEYDQSKQYAQSTPGYQAGRF